MHIEHANECRPLTAIVIERKHLEASIVLGSQITLQVVFVGKCLQLATGIKKLLRLIRHTIVSQQVGKNLEVASLVSPRILRSFLQIREGAPLPHLMGQYRLMYLEGDGSSALLHLFFHFFIEVIL